MEVAGNSWVVAHRAFGPELYNGTAGIALFLARLFEATNEKLYRTTAEGGMKQALSRLDDINPGAHAGFYSGLVGIAYTLLQLGETFGNEEFIDKALHILEDLLKDEPDQQGLDVLAGISGAIPVLLSIHQRYQKDFLVDMATGYGEHLLKSARKSEQGWSWNTLDGFTQHDLTGFSHGTAGIAWALLELFQVTQQENFRTGAEQGFLYERHWFSPQHGNWPDFAISVRQALKEVLPICSPGVMALQVSGYPGYGHTNSQVKMCTVRRQKRHCDRLHKGYNRQS